MPARKKKEKVEVVKVNEKDEKVEETPSVEEESKSNEKSNENEIEKIPESKQPNVPHVINQIIQQVQILTKQVGTLNSNIDVVKTSCEKEIQTLKALVASNAGDISAGESKDVLSMVSAKLESSTRAIREDMNMLKTSLTPRLLNLEKALVNSPPLSQPALRPTTPRRR